ncbi:putative RNA-directed DNA polymerase from transposon BS [Trichonephila clavipes]|nr:putative RNA-directed DNA polymerase from transposon BS [Trichonephila clavipes]
MRVAPSSPTVQSNSIHSGLTWSSLPHCTSFATNKNSGVPKYLRQLALDVKNGIPSDAILIYTDGSKNKSNRPGNGAFIEKLSIRLSRRNPENCSVLRCELVAIYEELKSILNRTDYSNIWILADTCSAIQHLPD